MTEAGAPQASPRRPTRWRDDRTLRWLGIGGSLVALATLALLCVVAGALALRWRPSLMDRGDGVAIVHIEGTISSSSGDFFSGQMARSDDLVRRLERLEDDPDVRAVVLRINSPGGGVVASDEIYSAVVKLRKTGKPVVSSMGELAASGGYYIAAPSDRIVANAQTTTGSIGVLAVIPVIEGLLQRVGVEVEIVRSGPLKGSGSGLARLDETERAVLQGLVDGAYDQFVRIVAEGRRMDPQRVRELADGRVYSGAQAQRLGLVDEIGDLQRAIDLAASLAGIEGKPRVIEERRPSLVEELLGSRAIGPRLSGADAAGLVIDRNAPLQYLYLGTGR